MQPKDRPFPKYARDYFVQLLQQYELLLDEANQPPPPSIARLIQRVTGTDNPDSASCADVFALESAYLFAMPKARLKPELILARGRLRDIVGNDDYAAYAK